MTKPERYVTGSARALKEPRPGRPTKLDLLDGLRVIQLGRKTSAASAGLVMQQLGAHVTVCQLEDPDESPGMRSRRDLMLDAGKETTSRGIEESVAGADIVIADIVDGLSGLAESIEGYTEMVRSINRTAWVTISAHGLIGPRRHWIGSDFTGMAAGGILGHSIDENTGLPDRPPGELALRATGSVAALAALHALDLHGTTREPQHMDVAVQETVISTGLTLEMAHALFVCPSDGGSARYGTPAGFFSCADGWIYMLVLEQHQWDGLLQAVDDDSLAGLRDFDQRTQHAPQIEAAISNWASTRSRVSCELLLQTHGVPCTAVNSIDDFVARARDVDRALGDAAAPVPFLADHWPESAWRPGLTLQDLTVIDAGHVLAVPLATAWLGAMGARVIKFEDRSRIDVYRRRGPFSHGVPGVNRSAYFNSSNHSKSESLTADADSGAQTLSAALKNADVVVQNVGPRRAVKLGISAAQLEAEHPHVLSISSSGFGNSGPWAGFRAYGHNLHAFSGLVDLMPRDAHDAPRDVGTPWADPTTSIVIATLVAAWGLSTARGKHLGVDVSMAEMMATQLFEYAAGGAAVSSANRDMILVTPTGLVATTIWDSESRARLSAEIGVTVSAGQLQRGVLDISHLWGDRAALELADALQSIGIPAAVVERAAELAVDQHLGIRGFYARVQSRTLGEHQIVGVPWLSMSSGRPRVTAALELVDSTEGS